MIKSNYIKTISKAFALTLAIATAIFASTSISYAKTTSEEVKGDYYELDAKSKYDISNAISNGDTSKSVYGKLSLSGDMKSIAAKNGVDAYEVKDGNIDFSYAIGSKVKTEDVSQWHVKDDKSKQVSDIKLDKDIMSGAVIVQTSLTGDKWVTDSVYTDIASDKNSFDGAIYTSNEIQQVNGCYYRIFVVYELTRKVEDKKILFASVDNYEEKRCAEVYEVYLVNSAELQANSVSPTATPKKELGSKINTGKDNGFSGNEAITNKDPHYGWNLGTFFVNGYTRETKDTDGRPIFLKNVGDRVTLWFNLAQDINSLNGKDNLAINEDTNGSDQFFEISKTNFKHGALIIRYTDFEGKAHEPVIYTDYLAASTKTKADTKVELFEEGDYEVALDYEIVDTKGVNSITNYRISFTFSIRNGNCMVYPFDTVSGAELADNAITENGFKLDMAKSRYLTIDVEKKAIKSTADGFSEDVRFNRPAKDGESYSDEGVYTFTVKNLYTGGNPTTKTVYVGKSPIIKALASGYTVADVNAQISDGAELLDDGTLYLPEPEPVIEEPEPVVEEPNVEQAEAVQEQVAENKVEEVKETVKTETETEAEVAVEVPEIIQDESTNNNSLPIIIGSIVLAGVLVVILSKKKKSNKNISVDVEEDEE